MSIYRLTFGRDRLPLSFAALLDMLDLLEMLDSFRHTQVRLETHAAAIENTRRCDGQHTLLRLGIHAGAFKKTRKCFEVCSFIRTFAERKKIMSARMFLTRP